MTESEEPKVINEAVSPWYICAFFMTSLSFFVWLIALTVSIRLAKLQGSQRACRVMLSVYFSGWLMMTFHYLPLQFDSYDATTTIENKCNSKTPHSATAVYVMASLYHTGFYLMFMTVLMKLHRNIVRYSDLYFENEKGYRHKWLAFLVTVSYVCYLVSWYYSYGRWGESGFDTNSHLYRVAVEVTIFLLGIYLSLLASHQMILCISMRWCFALSLLTCMIANCVRSVFGVCARDVSAFISSGQAFLYVIFTIGPVFRSSILYLFHTVQITPLAHQQCLDSRNKSNVLSQACSNEHDPEQNKESRIGGPFCQIESEVWKRQENRKRISYRERLYPLPEDPSIPMTSIYY